MTEQKRIRDYGIMIGSLSPGKKNTICDVKGVTVGHTTLSQGQMNTGVTAILPHQGNLFREKVIGASCVLNGFGKTTGTIQIDELGTIETPILLTNTLSVGICSNALVKYTLSNNPEIGRTTGTVNPVVGECNDMLLNDIRAGFIREEHVFEAIDQASEQFAEGSIGAGTGMVSFGLKGGIGSASRLIQTAYGQFTVGVLVLSNYGKMKEFRLNGKCVGDQLLKLVPPTTKEQKDRGSIMIVVATDMPVCARQLKRVIRRTAVGLSRTGSFMGHGSGDIALGFTTANKRPHVPDHNLETLRVVHESELDHAFLGRR